MCFPCSYVRKNLVLEIFHMKESVSIGIVIVVSNICSFVRGDNRGTNTPRSSAFQGNVYSASQTGQNYQSRGSSFTFAPSAPSAGTGYWNDNAVSQHRG